MSNQPSASGEQPTGERVNGIEKRAYVNTRLAEAHERHPELFQPIPTRIGQTPDNPEGYPNGWVADWRGKDNPENCLPIEECGEPLVNVAEIPGKPSIFSFRDYFAKLENSGYSEPLTNAPLGEYVRASVADKLAEAQTRLPEGFRIVFFDGWRSLETQYETNKICYDSLIVQLRDAGVLDPAVPEEQLPVSVREIISREAQNYISLPSPLPPMLNPTPEQVEEGKKIPSPHNTGGSIDVGIVVVDPEWQTWLEDMEREAAAIDDPFSLRKAMINFEIAKIYRLHSTLLDCGTTFDFASQLSGVAAFEDGSAGTDEQRDNRRMLYNVLVPLGFQPYVEEWWHYNIDNQMAAMTVKYATSAPGKVRFGGIDLSDEQKRHEFLHKMLFDLILEQSEQPDHPVELPADLVAAGLTAENFARLVEITRGDPRTTHETQHSNDMSYRGDLTELKARVSAALVQAQL